MQKYDRERMRGDDIKFIHIINAAIVVYNNSINMKILMSPWKYPAINLQIAPNIMDSIA